MTILPHLLVGSSVGALMTNLPLAITAGFFSHFLVDHIPHWDPKISSETSRRTKLIFLGLILIELAISGFVLDLFSNNPRLFWPGIVAAAVDLDAPLHISEKLGIKIHKNSTFHRKTTPIKGLLNQILVILFAGVFLYLKGYLL